MSEPLFLKSPFHEKIWGGQRLATHFGYQLPSQQTGEFWAISAHPNGVSIVENGRFAGWPLDELYAQHRELFGQDSRPVFPLLTKILDAQDWLSVQVHPDDAYGLAHEGELGKTECWYIIWAAPDAEIIYGHEAKDKAQLKAWMEAGQWDRLLRRVKVKAGDFFYVPAGTLHAIGGGILILETQQSSDTTYRVYDFDRRDEQGRLRDLHLDKALDVLSLGEPANSRPDGLQVGDLQVTTFVTNEFFTVYRWQLDGQTQMTAQAPYYLVSVLEGQGQLEVAGQCYPLTKGQHFILPSDVTTWSLSGQLTLLVSHP